MTSEQITAAREAVAAVAVQCIEAAKAMIDIRATVVQLQNAGVFTRLNLFPRDEIPCDLANLSPLTLMVGQLVALGVITDSEADTAYPGLPWRGGPRFV